MKKLFLHIKRLFRKFWFLIFICAAISLVFGLGILIVMTIISMLFFSDPVDVNDILKNFTDEQLEIVLATEMDEKVSDDDYLTLLAKYQSYFCPKKADWLTIWTGVEVTDTAYIHYYELKKNIEISKETQKKNLLAQINKNGVQTKRLIRSNRNLVFNYTYRKSGETFEIVLTPEDLKK